MISLWRIFWLEVVSLVRSWTALMLLVASLGWMFAANFVLVTDATDAGKREMLVRYGLGGVFALLIVAVLASATGLIASERESKRLQLTQVRPVSAFSIAWGKFLALAMVAAAILAFPCAALLVSPEFSDRSGSHVYRPLLESPKEEALKMYDAYMADPDTSPMVKKAHKSIVLRILEQRAKDHYQTVQTNETASWTFPGFYDWSNGSPFVEPSARFRFSNTYSMRDDVYGTVMANGFFGIVSNITQTAVTVPLHLCQLGWDHDVLSFKNMGDNPVMLRPRQDVELLVPADSFAWNLFRSGPERRRAVSRQSRDGRSGQVRAFDSPRRGCLREAAECAFAALGACRRRLRRGEERPWDVRGGLCPCAARPLPPFGDSHASKDVSVISRKR